MNKFFIAALAAAAIIPSAANAKPADHHRPAVTKVVVVDQKHAKAPAVWHRQATVQRITIGSRVDRGFIATHKMIKNPARYRLARTGPQLSWLRVRDDAVLVNLRTGRVVNIVHSRFG